MQKRLPKTITTVTDQIAESFSISDTSFVKKYPKADHIRLEQIDHVAYTDFPALHIWFKDGTTMSFRLKEIEE